MSGKTLLAVAMASAVLLAAGPAAEATERKYDEHLEAALGGPGPFPVIVLTHGEPGEAAAAARALGAAVRWEYELIDGFAATATKGALEALHARADVESIWLDRPTTPLMDVSHKAIGADLVWAQGYRGAGITVAVLDTGIDPLHPYFAGAIVSCVSTIGGLVSPECTDNDGHGTHVAGTVASRNERRPGIAPEASLAIVRVLHVAGAGLSSDSIAGMDWVAKNQGNVVPPIRVATMSVGPLNPGCGSDANPSARAANALVASGVPFTVAAGNDGHDECTVDGAAAGRDVVTVGAVNDRGTVTQDDDVIAGFSSGGPTLDGYVKPEIVFPGVGITSAFPGGGVLVATMSGTSMATPHAAGTAALLLQKEPGLSPLDVKERLKATAVANANTGALPNNVYGWGLGNACHALLFCGSSDPPTPTVRSGDVAMAFESSKGTYEVTTTVLVVDEAGAAVAGAAVSVQVRDADGGVHDAVGTSGADGRASVVVEERKHARGLWTACVVDIVAADRVYDPEGNVETCDSVEVA